MRQLNQFNFWRGLSLTVLTLVLAGCTVQYVSRYDADTERSITRLQTQVQTLLQDIEQGMGTPAADYENYTDAYKKLHVGAAVLSTRAQAIDYNRITIEESQELIGWLKQLEQLHKIGIGSPELLAVPRQQAEQIFVAMLKFELAKKRQLDPVF